MTFSKPAQVKKQRKQDGWSVTFALAERKTTKEASVVSQMVSFLVNKGGTTVLSLWSTPNRTHYTRNCTETIQWWNQYDRIFSVPVVGPTCGQKCFWPFAVQTNTLLTNANCTLWHKHQLFFVPCFGFASAMGNRIVLNSRSRDWHGKICARECEFVMLNLSHELR